MKIKVGLVSLIILICVGIFFGKNWLEDYYKEKFSQELIVYKQNHVADSTTIQRLQKDSTIMYQRYAYVKNLNDSLVSKNAEIIKERKETILALTLAKVKIKELESKVSEGIATVGEDSCTETLSWKNVHTPIMDYDLFVNVRQRWHNLNYRFTPFSLAVHITERRSDNLYGGYLDFKPDSISKYFEVTDMQVYLDDKFFKDENKKMIRWGVSVGSVFGQYNSMGIGVAVLYNQHHYFDYKYSFGNTHWLDYSYLFP